MSRGSRRAPGGGPACPAKTGGGRRRQALRRALRVGLALAAQGLGPRRPRAPIVESPRRSALDVSIASHRPSALASRTGRLTSLLRRRDVAKGLRGGQGRARGAEEEEEDGRETQNSYADHAGRREGPGVDAGVLGRARDRTREVRSGDDPQAKATWGGAGWGGVVPTGPMARKR